MTAQPDPWDAGDAKRLCRTEGLKEGVFCEYVCEVLQAMPIQNGKSRVLVVTDYTENVHLPYFDHHKATTPQGRRSLRVSLWDDHAFLSMELGVEQGHFLLLKNVVPKYPRMSQIIEVAMHGTRAHQRVRPKRSVVILDDHHHLVRELLNRKAVYESSLRGDSISGFYSIMPGTESSASGQPHQTVSAPALAHVITTARTVLGSRAPEGASASTPAPIPTLTPTIGSELEPQQAMFYSQALDEPDISNASLQSPVESKTSPFISMASQEEGSPAEFVSPPPSLPQPPVATPEANGRLSSGIKRESVSPSLRLHRHHQQAHPGHGHDHHDPPSTPHGQGATDSPASAHVLPKLEQQRPLVVEKPKQLNKIRIRGRVKDWNPGQIRQFLQCRCSACSTIIAPITAKPVCPQRGLGCLGEPQLRYEFSLVILDEFNQQLTVQVPSNVAAVKMGMTDPCNWASKNKQSRYEEACKALAKYGIYDKTCSEGLSSSLMPSKHRAASTLIDLDLVVSLIRPSTTAKPVNSSASSSSSPCLESADETEWSVPKKRLFTSGPSGTDDHWKKRKSGNPTSMAEATETTATVGVSENVMELVSINVIAPPPPPSAAPQTASSQQQHLRQPSATPSFSRPREPTPRYPTPRPLDRKR